MKSAFLLICGYFFAIGCTKEPPPPHGSNLAIVKTTGAFYIESNNAYCIVELFFEPMAPISEIGICWSQFNHTPTVNDSVVYSKEKDSSVYYYLLSNLQPNSTYHFRAYARNEFGVSYGEVKSFRTLELSLPILDITSIENIDVNSAIVNSKIVSNGNGTISAYGQCWSNSTSQPTVNNSRTEYSGLQSGTFENTITLLNENTRYYIRSYAINDLGVSYGTVTSFTTLKNYLIGSVGPAGGIVFYDQGAYINGWRFMEVSNIDQSVGAPWGCYGTSIINAVNTATGAGKSNTTYIKSGCYGSNIAAAICDAYIQKSYSDWFLPSYDELYSILQNLKPIGLGNFTRGLYWSSSQYDANNSYLLHLVDGFNAIDSKNNNHLVRAVRRF